MTEGPKKAGTPSGPARRQITIERTYQATLEDVWELWTTKEGIESWWGPAGFSVTVRKLELRPGGEMHYTMTATAPEQIDFMKRAGMPLSTEARVTYTEIVERRRLAYSNLVDFVPGVGAYDTGTVVELRDTGKGVQMVIQIDAMHDETWTQRMVMGWESQLGKLPAVLAR